MVPILVWRITNRVLQRMTRIVTVEAITRQLERAREAHDFGRDEETRPDAGLPGDQSNLFPVHPGRMTLAHLSQEKLPKGVDLNQD
jgi:hypothetical protein